MSKDDKWIVGGILGLVAVILLSMWAWPHYRVYSQQKRGEAALREAESSRQIAIEEAKAKKESAKMLSEAEIERARGVAEANKIIAEGLKDNHEYLLYLWIQGLQDGTTGNQVIYVPTEAGLPILEADRLSVERQRVLQEQAAN